MSEHNVKCYKVGCPNPATHHLRLKAWGEGELHMPVSAVEAQIPAPLLCEQCANSAIVNDVLTVEGWAAINKRLMDQGRLAPGKDDVVLIPTLGFPLVDVALLNKH